VLPNGSVAVPMWYVSGETPRPVAVEKLLAKTAEECYQTAADVESEVSRARLLTSPGRGHRWLPISVLSGLLPSALTAHARRLYATVTDRTRVAAALLASRMARGSQGGPAYSAQPASRLRYPV
jgi:hypothetical protein